ncbi:transcription factor DP [Striga asiatica]|uniref:Transcription factor DP n=1 Tax=Striga asiatica TaxID=4170 RepID=A0A5A7RJ91_STRAF|nr:transcription factor DP [Striga asiatica]
MVNISNNKNLPIATAAAGGGGSTRSWTSAVSGQSMSTSGSVGSPSSRSEATATAGENTFLLLNNLDIKGDDNGSQETPDNRRKKRGQRAAGGDKNGRGLRQFSMKVCEKVESKGRTTYNEHQYEEKNIRRRVYDALNVLMAMDIISKDKKEIQWKGLPRTSVDDVEEFKAERLGLQNSIEKKAAYLEELEEQFIRINYLSTLCFLLQYIGLQNLIQRNKQLHGSENAPNGGVALPFILVQTRPHATVEVEISEDMQLVHFDFNSTPFELHDDNYVLKAMKFGGKNPQNIKSESSSMANMYQSQANCFSRPSLTLPGILKARVKHER